MQLQIRTCAFKRIHVYMYKVITDIVGVSESHYLTIYYLRTRCLHRVCELYGKVYLCIQFICTRYITCTIIKKSKSYYTHTSYIPGSIYLYALLRYYIYVYQHTLIAEYNTLRVLLFFFFLFVDYCHTDSIQERCM